MIRDYFLGRLSDTEGERFEEELALDDELFADAEIVERELIDDYVSKELSASDRSAFEKNYLVTDARRDKLFLVESLWRVASGGAPAAVVEKEPRRSWFGQWHNWHVGVAVTSVAAVVLLVALVVIPRLVEFG